MKRTSFVFRSIAWALLGAFFLEPIAQAAPEFPAARTIHFSLPSSFRLPASVARVRDRFDGGSTKLFLIEDAHTNPSGQLNLAKTLEYLFASEPSVSTVFVEAGRGDNSLTPLRAYGDAEFRRRKALRYVRSGELHGEEFFNLISEKPFTIWGVEDLSLYARSVENYRRVARKREKLQDYLSTIGITVDVLQKRLVGPELASVLDARRAYQRGDKGIGDYFAVLSHAALFAGVSPEERSAFKEFERVREAEARIDFAAASREQAAAIARLPQEERRALAESARKASKASKYRPDDRAQDGFFAALEEKLADIRRSGRSGESYSELSKYFDYRRRARAIEPERLIRESRELENEIVSRLAQTDDERQVVRAADALDFWKKLFDLALTPDEFGMGREFLQPESIRRTTGFLNRKIADLETLYERALFLEPGFEEALAAAKDFYELTAARDKRFVSEALRKMGETGRERAVLVTGGFHTPHLKKLLRDRNISYACLTPQVLAETNRKRYEQILLGQPSAGKEPKPRAAASTNRTMTAVLAHRFGGARMSVYKKLRLDFSRGSAAGEIRSALERKRGVGHLILGDEIEPGGFFDRESLKDFLSDSLKIYARAVELHLDPEPDAVTYLRGDSESSDLKNLDWVRFGPDQYRHAMREVLRELPRSWFFRDRHYQAHFAAYEAEGRAGSMIVLSDDSSGGRRGSFIFNWLKALQTLQTPPVTERAGARLGKKADRAAAKILKKLFYHAAIEAERSLGAAERQVRTQDSRRRQTVLGNQVRMLERLLLDLSHSKPLDDAEVLFAASDFLEERSRSKMKEFIEIYNASLDYLPLAGSSVSIPLEKNEKRANFRGSGSFGWHEVPLQTSKDRAPYLQLFRLAGIPQKAIADNGMDQLLNPVVISADRNGDAAPFALAFYNPLLKRHAVFRFSRTGPSLRDWYAHRPLRPGETRRPDLLFDERVLSGSLDLSENVLVIRLDGARLAMDFSSWLIAVSSIFVSLRVIGMAYDYAHKKHVRLSAFRALALGIFIGNINYYLGFYSAAVSALSLASAVSLTLYSKGKRQKNIRRSYQDSTLTNAQETPEIVSSKDLERIIFSPTKTRLFFDSFGHTFLDPWKGVKVFRVPLRSSDHAILLIVSILTSSLVAMVYGYELIAAGMGMEHVYRYLIMFGCAVYFPLPHLKQFLDDAAVARNIKAYSRNRSSVQWDKNLFDLARAFEKETGWQIIWTDSDVVWALSDAKTRRAYLSAGWIVRSDDIRDRRRSAYLMDTLRTMRRSIVQLNQKDSTAKHSGARLAEARLPASKKVFVYAVMGFVGSSLSLFLLSAPPALYFAWIQQRLDLAMPFLPLARTSGMAGMLGAALGYMILRAREAFPLSKNQSLAMALLSALMIGGYSEFRNDGKFHLKNFVHFFGPGTWAHDGIAHFSRALADALYTMEFSHWNDFLMGAAVVNVLFAVLFAKVFSAYRNQAPISLRSTAGEPADDNLSQALRPARIIMNVGLWWFFLQAWGEKAGYLSNPHSADEIDFPFEAAGTAIGFWMARILTEPFGRPMPSYRSTVFVDFAVSGLLGLAYTMIISPFFDYTLFGVVSALTSVTGAVFGGAPPDVQGFEYTAFHRAMRPVELGFLAVIGWLSINRLQARGQLTLLGRTYEEIPAWKTILGGIAATLGLTTAYLGFAKIVSSLVDPGDASFVLRSFAVVTGLGLLGFALTRLRKPKPPISLNLNAPDRKDPPESSTGARLVDMDPAALDDIEKRLVWLSSYMIDEANRYKVSVDVGGHPTASTSALHLMMAVHLFAKTGFDHVADKPHAAPMLYSILYLLGYITEEQMHLLRQNRLDEKPDPSLEALLAGVAPKHREHIRRLARQFQPAASADPKRQTVEGLQSYPGMVNQSEGVTIPTGSVGLGPSTTVFLALMTRWLRDHGFEVPPSHYYAIVGDAETDEGNLMESLSEAVEYKLGNVTHLIDYNRQSLDGDRSDEKLDRMVGLYRSQGWKVIELRWGSKLEKAFEGEGALFKEAMTALRSKGYQSLLAKNGAEIRRTLVARTGEKGADLEQYLSRYTDDQLRELYQDLGGHDVAQIVEALAEAKSSKDRPVVIVAHTIKGWGLPSLIGRPGNHKERPKRQELEELRAYSGIPEGILYPKFDPESSAGRFLEARRQKLDGEKQQNDAMAARNRELFQTALKGLVVPDNISSGVSAQMASKIHSHGVLHFMMQELDRIAGTPVNELEPEELWLKPFADRMIGISPDTATSTIFGAVVKGNTYGPDNPKGRHVILGIKEMSAVNLALALGWAYRLTGVTLNPIVAVYDMFLDRRALDQIFYAAYTDARLLMVGTPSGSLLATEGAQHQSMTAKMLLGRTLPNVVMWELGFPEEDQPLVEADRLRRMAEDADQGRRVVYYAGSTYPINHNLLWERLSRQKRFEGLAEDEIRRQRAADVLAGGYRLIDYTGYEGYETADNVVNILVSGPLVEEAIKASDALLEKGIFANVIEVTSPTLLLGHLGQKDGYRQLRKLIPANTDPMKGETLWTPIVTVADAPRELLAGASGILGIAAGETNLGISGQFGKSFRDPSEMMRYHHIGAADIAANAIALREARDVPGGAADRGGARLAGKKSVTRRSFLAGTAASVALTGQTPAPNQPGVAVVTTLEPDGRITTQSVRVTSRVYHLIVKKARFKPAGDLGPAIEISLPEPMELKPGDTVRVKFAPVYRDSWMNFRAIQRKNRKIFQPDVVLARDGGRVSNQNTLEAVVETGGAMNVLLVRNPVGTVQAVSAESAEDFSAVTDVEVYRPGGGARLAAKPRKVFDTVPAWKDEMQEALGGTAFAGRLVAVEEEEMTSRSVRRRAASASQLMGIARAALRTEALAPDEKSRLQALQNAIRLETLVYAANRSASLRGSQTRESLVAAAESLQHQNTGNVTPEALETPIQELYRRYRALSTWLGILHIVEGHYSAAETASPRAQLIQELETLPSEDLTERARWERHAFDVRVDRQIRRHESDFRHDLSGLRKVGAHQRPAAAGLRFRVELLPDGIQKDAYRLRLGAMLARLARVRRGADLEDVRRDLTAFARELAQDAPAPKKNVVRIDRRPQVLKPVPSGSTLELILQGPLEFKREFNRVIFFNAIRANDLPEAWQSVREAVAPQGIEEAQKRTLYFALNELIELYGKSNGDPEAMAASVTAGIGVTSAEREALVDFMEWWVGYWTRILAQFEQAAARSFHFEAVPSGPETFRLAETARALRAVLESRRFEETLRAAYEQSVLRLTRKYLIESDSDSDEVRGFAELALAEIPMVFSNFDFTDWPRPKTLVAEVRTRYASEKVADEAKHWGIDADAAELAEDEELVKGTLERIEQAKQTHQKKRNGLKARADAIGMPWAEPGPAAIADLRLKVEEAETRIRSARERAAALNISFAEPLHIGRIGRLEAQIAETARKIDEQNRKADERKQDRQKRFEQVRQALRREFAFLEAHPLTQRFMQEPEEMLPGRPLFMRNVRKNWTLNGFHRDKASLVAEFNRLAALARDPSGIPDPDAVGPFIEDWKKWINALSTYAAVPDRVGFDLKLYEPKINTQLAFMTLMLASQRTLSAYVLNKHLASNRQLTGKHRSAREFTAEVAQFRLSLPDEDDAALLERLRKLRPLIAELQQSLDGVSPLRDTLGLLYADAVGRLDRLTEDFSGMQRERHEKALLFSDWLSTVILNERGMYWSVKPMQQKPDNDGLHRRVSAEIRSFYEHFGWDKTFDFDWYFGLGLPYLGFRNGPKRFGGARLALESSESTRDAAQYVPPDLQKPVLSLGADAAGGDRSVAAMTIEDVRGSWPYPNGSIGFITSRLMLDSLDRENLKHALAEMRRVAAPGAGIYLVLSSDKHLWAKPPMDLYRREGLNPVRIEDSAGLRVRNDATDEILWSFNPETGMTRYWDTVVNDFRERQYLSPEAFKKLLEEAGFSKIVFQEHEESIFADSSPLLPAGYLSRWMAFTAVKPGTEALPKQKGGHRTPSNRKINVKDLSSLRKASESLEVEITVKLKEGFAAGQSADWRADFSGASFSGSLDALASEARRRRMVLQRLIRLKNGSVRFEYGLGEVFLSRPVSEGNAYRLWAERMAERVREGKFGIADAESVSRTLAADATASNEKLKAALDAYGWKKKTAGTKIRKEYRKRSAEITDPHRLVVRPTRLNATLRASRIPEDVQNGIRQSYRDLGDPYLFVSGARLAIESKPIRRSVRGYPLALTLQSLALNAAGDRPNFSGEILLTKPAPDKNIQRSVRFHELSVSAVEPNPANADGIPARALLGKAVSSVRAYARREGLHGGEEDFVERIAGHLQEVLGAGSWLALDTSVPPAVFESAKKGLRQVLEIENFDHRVKAFNELMRQTPDDDVRKLLWSFMIMDGKPGVRIVLANIMRNLYAKAPERASTYSLEFFESVVRQPLLPLEFLKLTPHVPEPEENKPVRPDMREDGFNPVRAARNARYAVLWVVQGMAEQALETDPEEGDTKAARAFMSDLVSRLEEETKGWNAPEQDARLTAMLERHKEKDLGIGFDAELSLLELFRLIMLRYRRVPRDGDRFFWLKDKLEKVLPPSADTAAARIVYAPSAAISANTVSTSIADSAGGARLAARPAVVALHREVSLKLWENDIYSFQQTLRGLQGTWLDYPIQLTDEATRREMEFLAGKFGIAPNELNSVSFVRLKTAAGDYPIGFLIRRTDGLIQAKHDYLMVLMDPLEEDFRQMVYSHFLLQIEIRRTAQALAPVTGLVANISFVYSDERFGNPRLRAGSLNIDGGNLRLSPGARMAGRTKTPAELLDRTIEASRSLKGVDNHAGHFYLELTAYLRELQGLSVEESSSWFDEEVGRLDPEQRTGFENLVYSLIGGKVLYVGIEDDRKTGALYTVNLATHLKELGVDVIGISPEVKDHHDSSLYRKAVVEDMGILGDDSFWLMDYAGLWINGKSGARMAENVSPEQRLSEALERAGLTQKLLADSFNRRIQPIVKNSSGQASVKLADRLDAGNYSFSDVRLSEVWSGFYEIRMRRMAQMGPTVLSMGFQPRIDGRVHVYLGPSRRYLGGLDPDQLARELLNLLHSGARLAKEMSAEELVRRVRSGDVEINRRNILLRLKSEGRTIYVYRGTDRDKRESFEWTNARYAGRAFEITGANPLTVFVLVWFLPDFAYTAEIPVKDIQSVVLLPGASRPAQEFEKKWPVEYFSWEEFKAGLAIVSDRFSAIGQTAEQSGLPVPIDQIEITVPDPKKVEGQSKTYVSSEDREQAVKRIEGALSTNAARYKLFMFYEREALGPGFFTLKIVASQYPRENAHEFGARRGARLAEGSARIASAPAGPRKNLAVARLEIFFRNIGSIFASRLTHAEGARIAVNVTEGRPTTFALKRSGENIVATDESAALEPISIGVSRAAVRSAPILNVPPADGVRSDGVRLRLREMEDDGRQADTLRLMSEYKPSFTALLRMSAELKKFRVAKDVDLHMPHFFGGLDLAAFREQFDLLVDLWTMLDGRSAGDTRVLLSDLDRLGKPQQAYARSRIAAGGLFVESAAGKGRLQARVGHERPKTSDGALYFDAETAPDWTAVWFAVQVTAQDLWGGNAIDRETGKIRALAAEDEARVIQFLDDDRLRTIFGASFNPAAYWEHVSAVRFVIDFLFRYTALFDQKVTQFKLLRRLIQQAA